MGALAAGLTGCRTRGDGVVRIGYMTNLTHAPAILGVTSGRIAARARRARREPHVSRRTARHRGADGRRHRRGRLRAGAGHLHARPSPRRAPCASSRAAARAARPSSFVAGRASGARGPPRKDARHRPDRDDPGHRAAQVPAGPRLRARRARGRRDRARARRRDHPHRGPPRRARRRVAPRALGHARRHGRRRRAPHRRARPLAEPGLSDRNRRRPGRLRAESRRRWPRAWWTPSGPRSIGPGACPTRRASRRASSSVACSARRSRAR